DRFNSNLNKINNINNVAFNNNNKMGLNLKFLWIDKRTIVNCTMHTHTHTHTHPLNHNKKNEDRQNKNRKN
ncbi:unnamed protein product, partial [Sphagnum compactum]